MPARRMPDGSGSLLGGRLAYRQAEAGHRSGIEPVLLAASVAARAGERVIEAGTGAGAALLCLAWRVPGLFAVGLDRDAALAALAAENFRRNGFATLRAVAGDITQAPCAPVFDHAIANPPWREAAGSVSPDPGRRLARAAPAGLVEAWIRALIGLLRPHGTLSLILPARRLGGALSAIAEAGGGDPAITPLWPREGRPAKLVILQARRGGGGDLTLRPGLVLHRACMHGARSFTADAERILRDGAGLPQPGPP